MKTWPTNTGRPRNGLPLDAMWDRHYAFEWMGVPPDVAATSHFTRGIRQAMTTPPEYQRRAWVEFSSTRSRYSK